MVDNLEGVNSNRGLGYFCQERKNGCERSQFISPSISLYSYRYIHTPTKLRWFCIVLSCSLDLGFIAFDVNKESTNTLDFHMSEEQVLLLNWSLSILWVNNIEHLNLICLEYFWKDIMTSRTTKQFWCVSVFLNEKRLDHSICNSNTALIFPHITVFL